MTGRPLVGIVAASALGVLWITFPAVAHSQTRLSIRAGYASAASDYAGGWESGPELGVGITRWLSRTVGLEAQLGTTAYPSAVAEPVCLPELLCQTIVYSPGTLAGGQIMASLRPTRRWTISAGAGYTWAASKVAGPDSERLGSAALHAGLRVTPFSTRGQGLAFEIRGTRYSETIGSLRWALTPGVSWSF